MRELMAVVLLLISVSTVAEERFRRAPRKIDNEYVVTLRQDLAQSVVETSHALALGHRASVRRVFRHAIKGFAATMSEEQAIRMSRHPAVEFVEENAIGELSAICPASGTPCKTELTNEWHLDRMDEWSPAGQYSFMTTFSPARTYPVIIYPFDTGIQRDHDDFKYREGVPKFWPTGDGYRVAFRGWDYVEPQGGNVGEQGGYGAVDYYSVCPNITNSHTHGTFVASMAAGRQYGLARHAEIFPIRVVACRPASHLQRVVAAIDELVAEGSTSQTAVANFSLFFEVGAEPSALDAAINSLIARNIVVVTSANNHNADRCAVQTPARVPDAITVGATTNDPMDGRVSLSSENGSNFGACVDFFAPGHNLRGANQYSPDGFRVETRAATSYAAALVTGMVARFLEQFPNSTPAQVRAYLATQARPVVTNQGPGTTRNILTVRPENY